MYRRYDQGLGLYIHIPFCLKKCNYCDFYSLPVQTGILQRYVRAVVKELELRARDVEDRRIKSVYLGGGTPSLLSPSELSLIINSINLNWDLDNEAEVSLEANPASLNGKALEFIHKAGFNRISLGVQSFQDRDLQILGRSHSSQEAWQSIELIKNSGFSNLNHKRFKYK
jgi:oxygen-independent coproporphyrinogen-3 oxidase